MVRGLEYKRAVVKDLSDRFATAEAVVLVDFSGVSVSEITELRNKARDAKVDYIVAKNNLIRRAITGTPFECLEPALVGQTALGIGYDGSLVALKVLADAAKELEGLKIKAGFVDGEYASAAEVVAIAKLPSKPELVAKLAAVLQAPISKLLFVLNGPVTGLVRTLQAIKEKKEGNQSGASK